MRLALAACLLCTTLAPAGAQPPPRGLGSLFPAPSETGRAGDIVEAIERQLDEASRKHGTVRSRIARLALNHLLPMIAATPGDSELHWLAGRAWNLVSDEGDSAPPDDEGLARAVAELEKARALGPPGARDGELSAELGDLLGRIGRYDRAVAEYDRAIALQRITVQTFHSTTDDQLARLYGNSAELAMAAGHLDDAITRYRLAAAFQPADRMLPALPWWGLAVAYDRDGQLEKARAATRRAIELDNHLESFDHPGVYFVPRGDRWYYLGLAHEMRGERAAAEAAFRHFLEEQPSSPWRARADAHLAELARASRESAASARVALLLIQAPGRDPDAVRRVVLRSEPDLRRCLLQSGESGIDLHVTLQPSGRVALLLTDPAMPAGPCVEAVAARWTFPVPSGAPPILRLRLHLDGDSAP